MRGVSRRSPGRGESVHILYIAVIAKERSDCGTEGNVCGAIRSPLSCGHAPSGADTSSDPLLAGHLLLKKKALLLLAVVLF